jgi:hypothetical protein
MVITSFKSDREMDCGGDWKDITVMDFDEAYSNGKYSKMRLWVHDNIIVPFSLSRSSY